MGRHLRQQKYTHPRPTPPGCFVQVSWCEVGCGIYSTLAVTADPKPLRPRGSPRPARGRAGAVPPRGEARGGESGSPCQRDVTRLLPSSLPAGSGLLAAPAADRAEAEREPAALPRGPRPDPRPPVRTSVGSRAEQSPASSARRRGSAPWQTPRKIISIPCFPFFFFFFSRLPNWPRRPKGHTAQGRRTETATGVREIGKAKARSHLVFLLQKELPGHTVPAVSPLRSPGRERLLPRCRLRASPPGRETPSTRNYSRPYIFLLF